jgi:hypothetical protein
MHVVHLLAVTAESAEDAIKIVDSNLGATEEGSTWWDWYEIGGRWDGFLGEFSEGATNVLCCTDKEGARKALEWVARSQNYAWREVRDLMTGRQVSPDEAPEYIFGIPTGSSPEQRQHWADRTSEQNAESKELLDQMLASDEVPNPGWGGGVGWLVPWRIKQGMKLAQGEWYSDSHFWDVEAYTARPDEVLDGLDDGTADSTYLVVVDFHY